MSEQQKKPQAIVVFQFEDGPLRVPWVEVRAKELQGTAAEFSSDDPICRARGREAFERVAQELHDLKMGLYLSRLKHAEEVRRSSEGGALGAKRRWDNHWGEDGVVQEIIAALAMQTDHWGAPMPAKVLWPQFYGELDANHLNPKEFPPRKGDKVLDGDVVKWTGNQEGMTFKAFRNQMSIARGEGKK